MFILLRLICCDASVAGARLPGAGTFRDGGEEGLGDRGFMVFRGLWIEKRFTDSRCDAFETAHPDKFHEFVYPHFIGYDWPDTRIPLAGKQQVVGVIMIA